MCWLPVMRQPYGLRYRGLPAEGGGYGEISGGILGSEAWDVKK